MTTGQELIGAINIHPGCIDTLIEHTGKRAVNTNL